MVYLITLLLNIAVAQSPIRNLAEANGYNPSMRVVTAINFAANAYRIDPLELTAIAILESGLGSNKHIRLNKNGTMDIGLFQINTVNLKYCSEYNVETIEGSALCAAKLLSKIKSKHKDYLGRYHSKTPSKKKAYQTKATKILGMN